METKGHDFKAASLMCN